MMKGLLNVITCVFQNVLSYRHLYRMVSSRTETSTRVLVSSGVKAIQGDPSISLAVKERTHLLVQKLQFARMLGYEMTRFSPVLEVRAYSQSTEMFRTDLKVLTSCQLRSVFLFWTWHQVLIVIVEDCKGVFFTQATFSCSSSRVHNASFIVGKWLHPWEWLIGRCSLQLQLQERVFSNWCGHSSLHGCRGVEWLTPNLSHRYMKN